LAFWQYNDTRTCPLTEIIYMPNGNSKPRVLVVDDHPSILRFVQIGLEMRDFEVVTATSGEKALELIGSAKPDAVILDILMPDFSGFDLIIRLRETSNVPIIAMSADGQVRSKALDLGANAFVAKPFNTEDLVKRLKAILGD
jgi:two-component system, OmpR family, KDP operon response regulator KdpE